jgi:ABC-type Fe3+/spermidine/putrescine transport system ATPase subunit
VPRAYNPTVLDVSLQNVSLRRGAFELTDISLTFPAGAHTAVIGAPGSGATTLLDVIAGRLQPDRGEIDIGSRRVTGSRMSARPLLHATSSVDVPDRWSVQHALIAAVRRRSLDRVDRRRELELAVEKWELTPLVERRTGTLSDSERLLVHLARIELLKPAILVADRLLERLNASAIARIADRLYRTLRVLGTTVISAPASLGELGHTSAVVVLDRGRIVQTGTAAEVYLHPIDAAAAAAAGEVNRIPVVIRNGTVDSPIGSWDLAQPPFQGAGVALIRPEDLALSAKGEDSDLILGIEEARFHEGRWEVNGFVTGGLSLRVTLPAPTSLHKGKLIALRYDPSRFQLLPS